MTTASAHQFFTASASVAGALIGLLFVAISVAPERILGPDASEVHSVRAGATLTAFTNALTVSLFGLVPELGIGGAATSVAIVGLLFVISTLTRVIPAWRAKRIHLSDVSFLVGLLVVFVVQLIAGVRLDQHAHSPGDVQTICILVIVCFLIGITRAWELVGGPSLDISQRLLARFESRGEPRVPDDGEQ